MRKEYGIALYFALTISCIFLIKVFIFDGCYAFDSNDDANHTFVNLTSAREALKQGQWPEINLYNNFGTPIMGDALTFPFAVQSITYWFFDGPLAMTINRVLIGFLTALVLFAFYRQFFTVLVSLVCALLAFFSAGLFWNMAHHHYQMAMLMFAGILLLHLNPKRWPLSRVLVLLALAYLVMILSLSIQLVVIAAPFLLLFPVFGLKEVRWRMGALNFTAMLAALVATWPHTALFFQSIAESTRAKWSPYSGILNSHREQLLGLIIPPAEWMHYSINGHFTIVTYFSLAFIAFVLLGIVYALTRRPVQWPRILLILVLGLIPAVAAYWLQFHGQNLPLVRSVDSTRVWWFSNLFLLLAVGGLLQADLRNSSKLFRVVTSILAISVLILLLGLFTLIPEIRPLAPLHQVILWGTLLALILLAALPRLPALGSPFVKAIILGILILAQLPTLERTLGLKIKSCGPGNHFFADRTSAKFQPESLLMEMIPGSRMAAHESPGVGHALRAIYGGVLGSDARAIVSSQTLMELLQKAKLVQLDDNYFFAPPWQTERLSSLGIRYLFMNSASEELVTSGWTLKKQDQFRGTDYYLYENPDQPTPVHLKLGDTTEYLTTYSLRPNQIHVKLPQISQAGTLTTAFFRWNNWTATLNGRPAKLEMNSLGMMVLPVMPGDREVTLVYSRITGSSVLLYLFAALLILAPAFVYTTRSQKGPDHNE